MTTTTQIRSWWDPACRRNTVSLTSAFAALDNVFRKWLYKPRSGVTGSFNCRPITGGTNYSLHAFNPDGPFYFWTNVKVTKALAVDINWDKNPYGPELVTDMPLGMILEIEQIRTNNGKQVWRWGGRYLNNKDAMHFEIIVSPADLATGIKSSVVIPPIVVEEDDEDMEKKIVYYQNPDEPERTHAYIVGGMHAKFLVDDAGIKLVQALKISSVNTRATAFDKNWQKNMIIVDGPCKNV